MPRRIIAGVALALMLTGLGRSTVPHPLIAAGNGPTIALGAATGGVFAVHALAAGIDPYKGFNLHVATTPGAGLTLNGMSGSGSGGTLDGPDGVFCAGSTPAAGELNFGCVSLSGTSTTATGQLATITLQALGDGCITVRLIDLPYGDANAAAGDTFTVDQTGAIQTRQQNIVGSGTLNVFIGTGTIADCVDSDGDGCTNVQETGINHLFGGDRDPASPWDFGDMWTPSLPALATRNKAINISDVIAVLPWIGAGNNGPSNGNGNDYDSDTNVNGVEDGAEYDRSPSSNPAKPWRSGPPNGAVQISDAIVLLQQIGDHC